MKMGCIVMKIMINKLTNDFNDAEKRMNDHFKKFEPDVPGYDADINIKVKAPMKIQIPEIPGPTVVVPTPGPSRRPIWALFRGG